MGYTLDRIKGKVVAVKRVADGASIPLDPSNRDYQDFLTWNAQQSPPLDLSDTFDLADYKRDKNAAIDNKTQSLIGLGFTYASKVFSMSTNAAMNWTNLYLERTSLTYPLGVSTKDDGEHIFANPGELQTFYRTGLGFAKGHYDSGRALKLQVNAATIKAEVDAVIDNRG